MQAAVTILVTVWAGLCGLVAGSFLNVVAYRIPEGIPLTRENRCPRCGTRIHRYQNLPVVSWLLQGARCAGCGKPISVRYPVVELVTGVLFALVAYGVIVSRPFDARPVDGRLWFGTAEFWGVLLLLEVFAALTVVLTMLDVDANRQPNVILLTGWVAIVVVLLVTTAGMVLLPEPPLEGAAPGQGIRMLDAWEPFLRALMSGAAVFLLFFALRLVRPRVVRAGDVRLGGLAGTVLGWFGWPNLVVGVLSALVLAAVLGIALVLARRARRKAGILLGPWILAGAWIGIAAGEPISRWYLGLYA